MARPRIYPETILEIKQHRAASRTLDETVEQMELDRLNGHILRPMVSRNTVYKYWREFKILDTPYDWANVDAFDIPWEANGYLLNLSRALKEKDLPWMKRFFLPIHEPTVRQMQWSWKIHLAAPEVREAGVWILAGICAHEEAWHEYFDKPIDLQDIGDLLAYGPWKDQESRSAYDRALKDGRIKKTVRLIGLEGDYPEGYVLDGGDLADMVNRPERHSLSATLIRIQNEEEK